MTLASGVSEMPSASAGATGKPRLYVVTWFYDRQPGMAVYARRLRNLRQRYDLHLIARAPLDVTELECEELPVTVLANTTHRTLSIPAYCLKVARFLRDAEPGAVFLLCSALGMLVPMLRKRRSAIYWNEMPTHIWETPRRNVLKRPFSWLMRQLTYAGVRRAHVVMPISRFMQDDLVARGCRPESVALVKMGVDHFVQDDAAVPSGKALDEAEKDLLRVCYAGSLVEHKGATEMLEGVLAALRRGVPLMLTLAGLEPAQLHAVRQRFESAGLGDRIELLGKLPHEDICAIYRRMDVGISLLKPTDYNEFNPPTKLFEYLAMGLPVICNDIRTLKSYVSEGETCFSCAYSAEGVAEALAAAWQARQTLPAMRRACLEAGKRHDWKEIAPVFAARSDAALMDPDPFAQATTPAAGQKHSTKWAVIETVLTIAFPVLSMMILGRMLNADDYGYFGLAYAYIVPVSILAESLFVDYLLLKGDMDGQTREQVNAAHGFSIVFSAAACIALILLAPMLIPDSHEESVLPMQCLTLTILFAGFGGVPHSLLFREGRFKALAGRTVSARLFALMIAVWMAYKDMGVWPLVAVQVLNSLASYVAVTIAAPGWIKPGMQWGALRQSWWPVFQLNFNNSLGMFGKRLFLVAVARNATVETIGYLEMAMRISEMVSSVFQGLARRIALPIYMKPGDDMGKVAEAYWGLTRATCLLSLPVFGAMVVAGPWLLETFIDPKWAEAGLILQMLALAGGLLSLRYYAFDMINLSGRIWINIFNNLVIFGLLASADLWGDLSTPTGLGIAWVIARIIDVILIYLLCIATRSLKTWSGSASTFAFNILFLVIASGFARLADLTAVHSLMWLIMSGVVFIGMAYVFARKELGSLLSLVKRRT